MMTRQLKEKHINIIAAKGPNINVTNLATNCVELGLRGQKLPKVNNNIDELQFQYLRYLFERKILHTHISSQFRPGSVLHIRLAQQFKYFWCSDRRKRASQRRLPRHWFVVPSPKYIFSSFLVECTLRGTWLLMRQ
jgi:hypothetical protein